MAVWRADTPEFIETELFLRGEDPLPLKLVFGAEGSGRAADRDRVLRAMQEQQRQDSRDSTRAALFAAAPSEPAAFNPLSLPMNGDGSCAFDRVNKGILALEPGHIITQNESGSLTALCSRDQMLEGVHY
eukprot:COSAG04_NODE_11081_length_732_cov_0.739336_1_plen_129_part_10